MAAAASGKTRPSRSSNQSWSPNSEQSAEDDTGSSVDVLVSEEGQQSSSSGLTLPRHHQQTGTQMQSAFPPLDQPLGGLCQYQPTWNDQTPTETGAPVVYQPSANGLTLPAGANANSGRALPAIKMLSCQMRLWYTTSPLRDARLVEDAASGASVHSLPHGNANVLPAICAEHDSLTVKHVSSNGAIAKPTITTYMHIVSTG